MRKLKEDALSYIAKTEVNEEMDAIVKKLT